METRQWIRIQNGTKKFKEKTILEHANIEFHSGEITAIISPNGSGKTTTIHLISGFINLDEGERSFSNQLTNRDISIVLGGEKNLYMKNTAEENIYYLSMLKGLNKSQISGNIEYFQHLVPSYHEIKHKVCEQLSHGQKRLVSILSALVSDSKVIILDETTEGLDRTHVELLSNILQEVKKEKIIILCSQDYDFVDSISDRIYFLKDRHFILSSKSETLQEEYTRMFGGKK